MEVTSTDTTLNINMSMIYIYILLGAIAVLLVAFIVLLVIVLVRQSRLSRKCKDFMRGSDAETMEETILKRFKEIDRLIASDAKKEVAINEINENLLIATQKVGIVKYDAFKEMGGKLSFALALLDKNNTGFVINAMHSREGCYTYIKEVIKGNSFIALGDEEKKAVDMAINCDIFESI